MKNAIARREWLKQTSMALAATGFIPSLFHGEKMIYPPPAVSIRLHANENPYGPSPLARTAMAAAIAGSNRYPWEQTTTLREKIGQQYQLSKDHVLMGAGSSEILGLVASFAALQPGNMISATPTFNLWWTVAQQQGMQVIEVPLTAGKEHDLPAMLSKITPDTRLVYVCNPNNPTGTIVAADRLSSFIIAASQKALVLLDEAYLEYTEEPSLAPLLASNKRLVIAKTFSKIHGMAGARIGYALAHPDLIQQLTALQPWANAGPSAVSVAGALASLDDKDFLLTSKKNNAAVRGYTAEALKAAGLPFIPSYTNFLYYSLQQDKGDFLKALANNNIRVGRIVEEKGKWARISIGTQDDMLAFVTTLRKTFTT
ncbi:histidinol-phosphate aminotransferase family protein [Paraflavitalea soli]|uniref:Histidinol-phosphate aminotransferase family protein n=1 Tax=Paraflavitalea soli TaxID=2315862 RepID=A0A3B7MY82_9BACT|nr:histidinol-phosphate transaminase [Paraflavitalea soli]AXY78189.1 histidinol-phosphate aminotransferase family protein [Paraflavitalea soli]